VNYLSVETVSKSYGEKQLFENISFGLEQGQKTALLAKNGSGKTTLLKILAGKDIPDSGKVTVRKDVSVGFLEQEPAFDLNATVLESILKSDNEILKVIREYEHALTTGDEKLLMSSMEQMDHLSAWDYEAKVNQILTKLNIVNLNQTIKDLSGGQRKRVALARLLIQEHDLLILDEPTNHLDVDMIEWLENYLIRQDVTLLLVTHDRYFLDRITTEIIELDNKQLYKYKGNYSYFIEKKAEREFNEMQEVSKAKNLMKRELEWIRRMPKARGTKSKSRVDAFYDLKEKATSKAVQDKLQLDVKMSRVGGKILELKKIYKSFGDFPIVKGFDYTFKTGERIGVVGKNGVGKTTFLNILTGKEQPDSGKVNTGDTIIYGYYSQQGLLLNEDKRVIEVVKEIADVIPLADGSSVSASQFLQLFQFPPDMQYTFVSKLSGGEKRRLYLLTVLMKNPNFLILDEPTNDLDLLTLTILEEFLLNFKGCLIIVSHDRFFMDKLVDHLFVFEGDGIIKDYNGSYADYRDMIAENERDEKQQKGRKEEKPVVVPVPVSEPKRKLSFKEKYEYDNLEGEIFKLDVEKKELEGKLQYVTEHIDLQKLTERLSLVIQLIDEKSLRWLELSEFINQS